MLDRLQKFLDKPANIASNRTFEEEARYRLEGANRTLSQSGSLCQLVGLILIAVSPFAIAAGWFALPVAASLIAGGATSAALGSIAHSNKRASKLLYADLAEGARLLNMQVYWYVARSRTGGALLCRRGPGGAAKYRFGSRQQATTNVNRAALRGDSAEVKKEMERVQKEAHAAFDARYGGSQRSTRGEIHIGPRGGRYRINSKGRKSYDV